MIHSTTVRRTLFAALLGPMIGPLVALTGLGATGCRGNITTQPPVQPMNALDDMMKQPKYKPEAANAFFADGRAMRPLVEGTMARGWLKEDVAYYQGTDPKTGQPLLKAPITVNEATLRRGQERFNIYCSPCHDRAGSGHGLVVQRGFFVPPDLAERGKSIADGQIFQTITHGVRNMPAYGNQIPEADRWAIVTWVRVLGRSQRASLTDVPAEMRNSIEPEGAKQ